MNFLPLNRRLTIKNRGVNAPVFLWNGSPGRARTADRVINSHLLYLLSYRGRGGGIVLMTPLQVNIRDVISCWRYAGVEVNCVSLVPRFENQPFCPEDPGSFRLGVASGQEGKFERDIHVNPPHPCCM